MRAILAVALGAMVAFPALAKPPPGIALNSAEHHWWDAQREADGAGMSCCGQGDGHVLKDDQWRGVGTAAHPYQVEVGGAWFTVPPSAVTRPQGIEPSVSGRWQTKVWYGISRDMKGDVTRLYIYCFEPAAGF